MAGFFGITTYRGAKHMLKTGFGMFCRSMTAASLWRSIALGHEAFNTNLIGIVTAVGSIAIKATDLGESDVASCGSCCAEASLLIGANFSNDLLALVALIIPLSSSNENGKTFATYFAMASFAASILDCLVSIYKRSRGHKTDAEIRNRATPVEIHDNSKHILLRKGAIGILDAINLAFLVAAYSKDRIDQLVLFMQVYNYVIAGFSAGGAAVGLGAMLNYREEKEYSLGPALTSVERHQQEEAERRRILSPGRASGADA